MESLAAPPDRMHGNRIECQSGWYRFVFDRESPRDLPELSGFDRDAAGYRIARFQVNPNLLQYALFRGASFAVEAGDSPSIEILERGAYWNDCLLLSFDRIRGAWKILSNRAASIPVFWTSVDGQTQVSNNMSWLGGSGGPIDEVAFAETLLWDVPLGDRTLRKSIRQLPAGYELLIASSGVRTERKFVLDIRPSSPGSPTVDPEDLTRQGAVLNARAVERAISPVRPLILPISGGLDSRCILGSVPPGMLNRCSTVSFGQPGALEIRLGRAVAAECGVSWRSYTLDSAHYTSAALPESICAGCGMTPMQHLHLFSALRPFARDPSQILIGFMGDPVAGADSLEASDAADAGSAVALMFGKAGLTRGTAEEFFGRQTVESVAGDIESIYRNATAVNPREAFLEYYFIVERQSKLVTHIFNHLHWSGHALGFPFMDGAWARFFLALPPELRANRSLFKRILSTQRPDLAGIPSTADFAPLRGSGLLQRSAGVAARNWNRACTLSQRISEYRYSLPNPFATELQGIVLRGPLHNQLLLSVEKLRASGLISGQLANSLMGRRSFQYPWSGFRAISAAHCLEKSTQ